MHLALLKDMEESWRQAWKEGREVLSTEEEDRNLASLKDELEWFIGGRKGLQTRSKGEREHWRVVSWMGKTNVGQFGSCWMAVFERAPEGCSNMGQFGSCWVAVFEGSRVVCFG